MPSYNDRISDYPVIEGKNCKSCGRWASLDELENDLCKDCRIGKKRMSYHKRRITLTCSWRGREFTAYYLKDSAQLCRFCSQFGSKERH
jgi:hypothetical protein